ncbi:histidine phosphatase family protein [Streptomyces sp. Edi4]|uniref:histidine phosphatase family protein n=1 Tax=Streptomyces sp. Edi4 TaxID=3162527 RepID=UPI003305F406
MPGRHRRAGKPDDSGRPPAHAAVTSSEVHLPDDRRSLTRRGHAAALRPVVRRYGHDAVWCSRLRRAVETWGLAGAGLGAAVHLHKDLRERSFPSLEGLTLPQIAARIVPAQRPRWDASRPTWSTRPGRSPFAPRAGASSRR